MGEDEAHRLKSLIQSFLPESDGFEVYLFSIGDYNASVEKPFHLDMDSSSVGLLILSTPDMFDVAFRRWVEAKVKEFGSLEEMSEKISSPIEQFMSDRLSPIKQMNHIVRVVSKLGQNVFGFAVRERIVQVERFLRIIKALNVPFEVLHDHSLWPTRKPKILMQTCGHIAGAAYYYQPMQVKRENWPSLDGLEKNCKFIGLSLHPVFGGHFAFRSVFLFPGTKVSGLKTPVPRPILTDDTEVEKALEKFNYSWRDSGFRDFGNPSKKYSECQMNFFGKPPAERWTVLKSWVKGGEEVIESPS